MSASLLPSISSYPLQSIPAGTVVLQRSKMASDAIYIESGRVALGVAHARSTSDPAGLTALEHQLGVVEGPAWLEANAAVLGLASAVDAVAETDLQVRSVPMADFLQMLCGGAQPTMAVLHDVARAHRQQTELAVSRLAKDAEARCAEWLLRHAESSDLGGCSVRLQQRKRSIAAQLGIAPETLSRVLRHLRERSLISGSGRVVNLVDPNGLRSLAGV